MSTALDVARYFVELAFREPVPEGLAPSRLQSLLYHAQGWHLGSFDLPLFPEPIELTPVGPEVGEVAWAVEKAVEGDPIRAIRPGDLGPSRLRFRDQQFVAAIWETYRGYSASGLRILIANERAWVEPGATARDSSAGCVVPLTALRWFYARRDELRGFDPQEWEAVTEGEAAIARGETVPWSEVKRRLHERRLSTSTQPAGP